MPDAKREQRPHRDLAGFREFLQQNGPEDNAFTDEQLTQHLVHADVL
jgi:hypothetical protein